MSIDEFLESAFSHAAELPAANIDRGLHEVLDEGRRRARLRRLVLGTLIVLLATGVTSGGVIIARSLTTENAGFVRTPGPPTQQGRPAFGWSFVSLQEAQMKAPYHIEVPTLDHSTIQYVSYQDQTDGGKRIFAVDLRYKIRGKTIHIWMSNVSRTPELDSDMRGFRGLENIGGRRWRRQDISEGRNILIQLSRRERPDFFIEVDGPVNDSFLRTVVASMR